MKTKKKVEQGKGTAEHLMTLGYLFYFMKAVPIHDRSSFGERISSPNRGQSPVEWGEIPYICTSIRTSVCTSVRPPWLAGSKAWLTGPEAWLAGSKAWLTGTED